MIDRAKLLSKSGNYKLATSGAVTDPTLLEIATQFENQVSRKMNALVPDQLDKRFTTEETILETTKYDGEGVFISYDKTREIFAFNAPSGRVRIGLPVLEELAAHLEKQGIQKGLFRAELYLPRQPGPGKRPSSADVLRASFGGTPEEIGAFKLVVLDIVMLDGKDLRPNQQNFIATWDLLGKLFGTDPGRPFHRAEGGVVPERKLSSIFASRIATGEEGLVVRRLQRLEITKVKPHLSIDAVVIGYVEGEFEGKYGVTSLLTALSYPEKQDGALLLQTFCRAGSGFSDQQREELLATFSALRVEAPLAMTDSDGRAVQFVKPVHIVELHGEDLVSVSGKDRENRTQLFAATGDAYRFAGLTAFPRLTFATFSKLRSDKTLATGGARIEQVVPNPQTPVFQANGEKPPETVRREVFAKGDAVRKLLVLKTGSERSVPYVVYWTDFSSKRKDPLKVTTECAYTETRAQALAERLLTENVTKGFVPVGTANGSHEPAAPAPDQAPEAAAEPVKAKRPRAKKAAPPDAE